MTVGLNWAYSHSKMIRAGGAMLYDSEVSDQMEAGKTKVK